MSYREELPSQCPPIEAFEPPDGMEMYRMTQKGEVSDDDFQSWQQLRPDKKYKSDCIARGLSVFFKKEDCVNLLKIPAHRKKSICKVSLSSDSGKILKTAKDSHFTWWPYSAFDILANCQAEVI